MRLIHLFTVLFTACFMTACFDSSAPTMSNKTPLQKPSGFVRINATIQGYSEIQPWERKQPHQRRGLGALLDNDLILTTSEMVTNQVYLELESADGSKKIPAKVIAVDRDVNLALVTSEKPASETFLKDLVALQLAPPLKLHAKVQTWQLERNGQSTSTDTSISAVDVVASYSGGKRFFSYLVKGSLQSATNSFTVPVLAEGMLAGLLTTYNAKEQISEVVSSTIINQFLENARNPQYQGFPALGIAGTQMPNDFFRNWLGMTDDEGGIYITKVAPNSSAESIGLQIGDVILEIDGYTLDRKGYYTDPMYGKLTWTHLIRGSKLVGDTTLIKIKRKGEIIKKEVTLKPVPNLLVPKEFSPQGPQYLIKGGVIFQQLTAQFLKAFGAEWSSRAPLNLLDIYYNSQNYEDTISEAVIITGIIPSEGTVGYENIRNSLVKEINGVAITKMADLETGFATPKDGIHHILLSEAPYNIYLNASICEAVDSALLQQGISSLQRILPKQ